MTQNGNHIILIGFMGAGKTSVGRRLARDLRLRFVDTDCLIEERQQTTINEIFASRGEEYFRDLETAVLEELLSAGKRPDAQERLVIAVGGGLPVRPQNREIMKKLGTVIYLRARTDTLVARLSGDTARPKLQGGALREKIESLMAARAAIYEETAAAEIHTDGKKLSDVVKEIENNVL